MQYLPGKKEVEYFYLYFDQPYFQIQILKLQTNGVKTLDIIPQWTAQGIYQGKNRNWGA